jgi:hypothetical protein
VNTFGNIKLMKMTTKEKLEEIAEEFAIGFAEWFDDLDEDYCKNYTMKELLEIYKKTL